MSIPTLIDLNSSKPNLGKLPPIGGAISKQSLTGMAFDIRVMGGNTFQFFIYPPQYGRNSVRKFDQNDIISAKALLSKYNTIPVIHSNYLHNFFKPNGVMISNLLYECEVAETIGAAGVVIHLAGGHNEWDTKMPIENFNNFVKILRSRGIKTRLLFENLARSFKGKCYSSIAQFAEFQNAVHSAGLDNYYGFCFDLCHANVQRKKKMNTFEAIRDYFVRLDKAIGLRNIRVIHFNDMIDWNQDKHGLPLLGALSNPYIGGDPYTIIFVLAIAKIFNIPMLIERHKLTVLQYGTLFVALRALAANIGDINALKIILDDFYLFKAAYMN